MFDMVSSVLKNLTSKPATRKYPYEKREAFKQSRGRVKGVDIDTCIFCGICARKCPADAIQVNRNEKSWEIDPFKCVVCGVCSEVCPKKCLHMEEQYTASSYKKENIKLVQKPKPPVVNDSSQAKSQDG